MPIKSRMNVIMGQMESEHPENLEKLLNLTLFTLSIYKYYSINTKLGENVYDHKISDEYDYGSNRTRTVWVICP